MFKIRIHEEFNDAGQLATALDMVADMVRKGNTRGTYPKWEIESDEPPYQPDQDSM